MNIEFAWPWLLAALPLPLLALLLPRAASATPAALRFPFYAALQTSLQSHTGQRSRLRLALATLAWLLLVLAAARPQLIGETVHLPISGRSLMLAVDISGSMQTEDMQINGRQLSRLTAVKLVAGEFIEQRKGDRIGLILFGDQAYLQAPLTFDRSTVRTLLDEAQIGLAGKRTAIGDAIGLAIKRLRKEPASNRVLILLVMSIRSKPPTWPPAKACASTRLGLAVVRCRYRHLSVYSGWQPVTSMSPASRLSPVKPTDGISVPAIPLNWQKSMPCWTVSNRSPKMNRPGDPWTNCISGRSVQRCCSVR